MTHSTPNASEREPVHIELEFVRAKEADDAFAFRFTRQTYLIRGRRGAYETAELPWSKELLRKLEEVRRPDRDPAMVAEVGGLLREFLEPAGWPTHESTIVQARAERRRVHLTIRSAAAELYALPWELLTLRADGQHLGALDHVLLRYAWPGTSTIAADDAANGSGRVLMAWSAAGGGVPAADQIKAVRSAMEGTEGQVEIVEKATYGTIADALEEATDQGRPFGALHLLCHGAEAGSTFGLSFNAEDDGRPAVVDAGRLQQLLAPYAHTLRLVVVSACDGGNMGEPGNRIGSVAQRLHRAGLQYVVASRYPLSARGSVRMTGALYEELWEGKPVERAFVRARAAASREVSQLDWASLQLYARPEDGDHGAVLAPARPEPEPEAEPVATAVAPAVPSPSARAVRLLVSDGPSDSGSSAGSAGWFRIFKWVVGTAVVVTIALVALVFLVPFDDEADFADTFEDTYDTFEDTFDTFEDTYESSAHRDGALGSNASQLATTGQQQTDPYADSEDEETTYPEPVLREDLPGTAAEPPAGNTPRQPRGVTRRKPPPTPTTQANGLCGKAAKTNIKQWMPPSGGGIFSLKVQVSAQGTFKLLSCKQCDAERKLRAKNALAGINAKKPLQSSWKGDLPCTVTVSWIN